MKNIVVSITLLISTLFGSLGVPSLPAGDLFQANQSVLAESTSEVVLSKRELSLTNRHANASVNEVFKKNILLNLAYLSGAVTSKNDLDWTKVAQPETFSLILQPGKTFAYHDHILSKYQASLAIAGNTHFNAREGYLSSGFLYGDGVCHLASILNWAAQDAGLDVLVTKAHSIAKIPDVPDQYGVSIYTIAEQPQSGVNNNLYITNNKDYPVEFRFSYLGEKVVVEVIKLNTLA